MQAPWARQEAEEAEIRVITQHEEFVAGAGDQG